MKTGVEEAEAALAQQERRKETLNRTIETSTARRDGKTKEQEDVGKKISGKDEAIKTKKDETLRGWTLDVADWFAFRWPYLHARPRR